MAILLRPLLLVLVVQALHCFPLPRAVSLLATSSVGRYAGVDSFAKVSRRRPILGALRAEFDVFDPRSLAGGCTIAPTDVTKPIDEGEHRPTGIGDVGFSSHFFDGATAIVRATGVSRYIFCHCSH